MNIIAYYTENKNQVIRIYSQSKLAQTDAKRRDDRYLTRTVNKAFDQKIAMAQFNGYEEIAHQLQQQQHNQQLALPLAPAKPVQPTAPVAPIITFPTGLVGEIAQFIYDAAPRPVKEVALAAALGLMAGICGRAYNISGTGLNQYILFLALTGVGKEAAAEGIDKLMSVVPGSAQFIGPSEISSGPALFKYLANSSQSFVSVLGEFGLRIKQLSSVHANGSEISLRRLILDVYHKSGFTRHLAGSAYSKKEDSSNAVPSPAFSILGESTPERFYENLSEEMITEGLLPRFLLIEYKGERPALNKKHTSVTPNFSLIASVSTLVVQCNNLNTRSPRLVVDVEYSPDALELLDKFNEYCDNRIRGAKEVVRHLWNRAHLKTLKLAALIAIGDNMFQPTISVDNVNWSINLVINDIKILTDKFESGSVGANSTELKQMHEITRIIKEYLTKDFEYVKKYNATQSMHREKIICNTYMSLRLTKLAAFKNDKLGGTNALKRTVQLLVDNGKLKVAGGHKFQEKHKTSAKSFHINPEIMNDYDGTDTEF